MSDAFRPSTKTEPEQSPVLIFASPGAILFLSRYFGLVTIMKGRPMYISNHGVGSITLFESTLRVVSPHVFHHKLAFPFRCLCTPEGRREKLMECVRRPLKS
ncbi:hypothetical protein LZ32DRAFT_309129 [Colletotrichum eremochloae]|nr:hypothetical protein LZ32DRAFT_309129 [Colletotrichum eremochloae]